MVTDIESTKTTQQKLNSILAKKIFNPGQKTKFYQSVATRLSKFVDKDPPWTWRYIYQVDVGKMKPSPLLNIAIEKMYDFKPKKPPKRYLLDCYYPEIKERLRPVVEQMKKEIEEK